MSDIHAVKDSGIFAIYWEVGDGWTRLETPDNMANAPEDVKRMIAENLLRQLDIPISIMGRSERQITKRQRG